VQPALLGIKLPEEPFENKTGDVFGRWIVQKTRQFVQILMIHFFEGIPGCGFHFCEIDQYAISVQRFAPQNHFNLPVVPVEIFTLPAKAFQVMSGSKTA
jgi:hypothetical protein